jgi:hypothetical protein
MKKLLTILLIALFAAGSVSGQTAKSISKSNGTPSREVTDLICPTGSIYSQLPDGIQAWSSSGGFYFCDNVIVAPGAPVTSITFWMLEGTIYNPLNVDIHFRQNAGGIPGPVIASFPGLWLTGVPTGETYYGIAAIAYTYILPVPVTLAAGDWVGIADYPDEIGIHHHYWLTSSDGDGSMYFTEGNQYYYDLSFCLGGGGIPETPVSNWALIIGVILIGTFVIVRFRRLV